MKDANAKFQQALIKTLKSERNKCGMSHEAIADKTGLSRQTIGKIESGISNPTMLTMFKITSAMGMTLEEFLRKM